MRAVIAVLMTASGFGALFWWLQQLPPPTPTATPAEKVVRADPPKRDPEPAPVPRRETTPKPVPPEPKPEKTPSVEESDPGLGLNEEFEIGFGNLVKIEDARVELQALQEELVLAEEAYSEARRQGTALQKRNAKRQVELFRDKIAFKVEEIARLTEEAETPTEPSDSDPDSAAEDSKPEEPKPDAEIGEPR